MYINLDEDLSCRMCGKVIVLTIRRDYDSRAGKIRDNKKEARRRNVDSDSRVDGGRDRDKCSSQYHSTLVRQGGGLRRRGR